MRITNPVLSLPRSPAHAHEMATSLIERNRGTFGSAHMGPDDDGSDGDNDAGDGSSTDGDKPKVNEHGFPDKTPLASMTIDQQAAYWKHQARKHEGTAKARADYDAVVAERDRLKREGMSADQQGVEDAKKAAREEGSAATRTEYAKRLVGAELRAELKGRVKADQVAGIVGPLDHTYFLTDSGEVDADKVSAYASGFSQGSTTEWPSDMGQGRRGSGAGAGKADQGRAEAERRGYVKTI